ncbi:peptidylprolyl isomerase [Brachybacterium vulturis]|uniref:Peptidylprolyl isomerase n=1 Tax=Brachybacterium vulturis TaxID=2017484 RepID=A0A291GKU4_9MICO|nr:peptidylprolyl isomerase [Brachybacterium vulturis]ATG50808.1 peptidylprolyl isomerase [Brachybacterium vulturis]
MAVASPDTTARHLAIAEAGKVAALAGDHDTALRHYREALRMVMADRTPEVFFRHYTQCVLESLERSGSFPEVIEYCERADAHYCRFERLTAFQQRDHAAMLERLGCVLVKAGRTDDALTALHRALDIAGADALPLGRTLTGWLRRGLHVQTRRLTELQDRHHYFTVRPDLVDAEIATALPASLPHTR